MTRYQARWDNSPLEAEALKMFARTPEPVVPQASAAPAESTNRADAQPNVEQGAQPEALQATSETPEVDHFSELLALAGDSEADPLSQIGRTPLPAEPDELDAMSLVVAAEADPTDPLAALSLEYHRALLSQRGGHAHPLKTATADVAGPVIRVAHDSFAELTSRASPEASLVDLLTEGKNVDTLLESLDTFGAEQIFEADQTHEILGLLAPRGLSARRVKPSAQLARAEHHMVSVDSHMPMPDSIEDETPRIADEHDH
jgi:hypothetical protein